jgi:hypothetical protein
MFSFLFPGEKKKFFFIKRKKRVLTRLMRDFSKFRAQKSLTYNNFYKMLVISRKTQYFSKLFLQKNNSNLYSILDKNNLSYFSPKIYNNENNFNLTSEPYLQRIRFKPGYQRI